MSQRNSEQPRLVSGRPAPQAFTAVERKLVEASARAWSEHYAKRAADIKTITADDLRARAR